MTDIDSNEKYLERMYSEFTKIYRECFKSELFNFIKPADIPIEKGDITKYINFHEEDIQTLKNNLPIYNLDDMMEDYGMDDLLSELGLSYYIEWDSSYSEFMKKLIIFTATKNKFNKLCHNFVFEKNKKIWKDRTLLANKDKTIKELEKQYQYELRFYGKDDNGAEAQGCFEAIDEFLKN